MPLLWPAMVSAQEPEPGVPSAVAEPWQLSLDVIKSRARELMVENNGLQLEYLKLNGDVKKLQQAILDQQDKNDQTGRLLNDRHGRTDQQVRIEELTQAIKSKKQELEQLKRKKTESERDSRRIKQAASDLEYNQEAQEAYPAEQAGPSAADGQLGPWRSQLEDENRREVLLENQLRELKAGGQKQNVDLRAVDGQNKQLQERLEFLQAEKSRASKTPSPVFLKTAKARRYDQLRKRKEELEVKVNAYELRLDQLGIAAVSPVSWPEEKKKLVHDMVMIDARNNKMRGKIKVLREDIEVLRDQVARLERRLDFARGP